MTNPSVKAILRAGKSTFLKKEGKTYSGVDIRKLKPGAVIEVTGFDFFLNSNDSSNDLSYNTSSIAFPSFDALDRFYMITFLGVNELTKHATEGIYMNYLDEQSQKGAMFLGIKNKTLPSDIWEASMYFLPGCRVVCS